ncbi:MAG: glycosyltransferase family 39 protein [Acidobacteria bacterium]|nr:glycosyltransferase family 39 protein [Acidobacteriota bacterium]
MAAVSEKSVQPSTTFAIATRRPPALLVFFAALFMVNLLLRVFYLRYQFVNGDEAVRALTATGLLDGARLYVDLVTDKPPGATWFYAAVFALFGRRMVAVHLAAAGWNFLTAIVVCKTAAMVYGKRAGYLAAGLFVYFSNSYFTPDMMAANTELLMALPYTAAFYLYWRVVRGQQRPGQPKLRLAADPESILAARRRGGDEKSAEAAKSLRVWVQLFGVGCLTGAAVLFKQLGFFNVGFFCACEIVLLYRKRQKARFFGLFLSSCKRLLLIATGLSAVFAALVMWLYGTGALESFWRYSFVMNWFYIDSLSTDLWLKFMFKRIFGYVGFNLALWALAAWSVWQTVVRRQPCRHKDAEKRRNGLPSVAAVGERTDAETGSDKIVYDKSVEAMPFTTGNRDAEVAVILWALVSLVAVFMSGRFFGHYFIQVLPALAILAAPGLALLMERWSLSAFQPRAKVIAASLLVVFVFGLVRIHHRTAILAYETLTGQRTRFSAAWGMSRREHEADIVSQALRQRLRAGEPLYIWDYALDVYWRTGCRPATRFITPNHLTGDFTDAEIAADMGQSDFWKQHRQLLLEDLRCHKPRIILDPTGGLENVPYAEIAAFMQENYQRDAALGLDPARPFVVYQLKERP